MDQELDRLELEDLAQLKFVNKTDRDVDVQFWVDCTQRESGNCFTLAPDAFYNVTTFVSYPWIFKDNKTKDKLFVFYPPTVNIPSHRIVVSIRLPVWSLRERCLQVVRDNIRLDHVDDIGDLQLPKLTLMLFCLLALGVSVFSEDNFFRDIIDFVNNGDYSWKAGENHVTDMGSGAHVLAGSRMSPQDSRLPTKPRVSHSRLPKAFDARENWAECENMWSIKDQGNCGTCWAVSTTSVMSDRLCIASGGQVQVNISAEQLAACCSDCGVGCDGGYPDKAWPYFRRHGLVTGGDYGSNEGCQPYEVPPYPGGSSSDQYLECSPKKCTNKNYDVKYKKDLHYGKTSYFLPNDVKSIQAEIMTNGPVVAGFTVYNDFFAYESGVYQHVTGDLAGGHAVRILGWGVEDGVDYWLIANSWNRTWGDNGYVKFIRGVNDCGIEEFVTAGLVEPF